MFPNKSFAVVLLAGSLYAQQESIVIHHEEPSEQAQLAVVNGQVDLTDSERTALTFTAYDLDVHINTETSGLSAHVRATVRNDGNAPLTHLPLQITSAMHWESVRLIEPDRLTALPLAQHELKTDIDHTGAVTEAQATLSQPLAPGESAQLDLLYSGTVAKIQSANVSSSSATSLEWDAISPGFTGIRGFGNVLWYPVAAPAVFLGDGNKLYDLVGLNRLRTATAKVSLRLTVEYLGEPQKLAFFCGQEQRLDAHSENPNEPSAAAPGIATATFAPFELGFHPLSLFLSTGEETAIAGGYLNIVSDDPDTAKSMIAPGLKVFPLLSQWLGARPDQQFTMLNADLPIPFESGPFVARPVPGKSAREDEEALSHLLAHAYTRNQPAWLDEGVAMFLSLLWTERNNGRDTALAEMHTALQSLALIEPDAAQPNPGKGEPLPEAHSEIYFRSKAAMVLWMLRSITSDAALQQAFQALRAQKNRDTRTFQQLLEQTSGKELAWFFDDWILNDRGLPDLSIASVTPRVIERANGYLVAVEVANTGGAAAEVPVTIRSGNLTTSERLRIPARSRATTRIVFNDVPQEVIVNDGSTPEQRTTTHSLQLNLKTIP